MMNLLKQKVIIRCNLNEIAQGVDLQGTLIDVQEVDQATIRGMREIKTDFVVVAQEAETLITTIAITQDDTFVF